MTALLVGGHSLRQCRTPNDGPHHLVSLVYVHNGAHSYCSALTSGKDFAGIIPQEEQASRETAIDASLGLVPGGNAASSTAGLAPGGTGCEL
jgi:hypothetical protein